MKLVPRILLAGALWWPLGCDDTGASHSIGETPDGGADVDGGGGQAGGGGVGGEAGGGGAGGAGGQGGEGGAGGIGGEAGGGGAGGQGGQGGAGGEGGEGGAIPCAQPPRVTAALVEDRLYRRGEPARIDFAVEPPTARVTFESDAGGRFTPRDGHVFWAAGGGEPGDVDWPWWTGPVTVTVVAEDGPGCAGEAAVPVTLAGDVLVAEWSRSYLFTLGSDGRRLGRFRQVGENGLRGIALIPRAEGGGLVVALRNRGPNAPPGIRRLDAEGALVLDFETRHPGGSLLYPDDREPKHLAWDPVNRRVLADDGVGSVVYRFDLEGRYVDSVEIPGRTNFNDHAIGFAVLGDGTVLAAHQGTRRIHRIVGDRTELFAEGGQEVTALGTGHDGGAVVVYGNRNDVVWDYFDRNGRQVYTAEYFNQDANHLTPFMDGYLATANAGSRLRYLTADLRILEGEMSPFQQTHNFDDLSTATGVVWLHED